MEDGSNFPAVVGQLLSLRTECDKFAFGKARDELESLLKKITTEDLRTEEEVAADQRAAAEAAEKKKTPTPKKNKKESSGSVVAKGLFLPEEYVGKAQNLGIQYLSAHVDYEKLQYLSAHVDFERLHLGYQYGSLGKAVADIALLPLEAFTKLSNKERADLTRVKQVLSRRNRQELTEVLMHLAGLSSHGDNDDEERRYRTKHFVLFLLEYCLHRDVRLDNYARLLRAMDLEVPDNFYKPTSVATETEKKYHAADQKTLAKQRIVAAIVGDESMEAVVVLYDAKTMAEGKHKNGPTSGKRNLPPKMRPLCELWATDNFDGGAPAHVHEEIAHFTGGTVVDYDTLAAAAVAAAPEPSISVANSIEDDAGTNDSVAIVDPRTYSKIIVAFRSFLDTIEKGNQPTAEEIARGKRLLASVPSSLTVVTEPTVDTSSTAPLNRGDIVSPLTLPGGPEHFSFHEPNNGYGDAVNGLSLTKKELICFLQQLRKRDDCPARDELDEHLTGEWGVPLEAPKTVVEPALTGCLDWQEYIEILRAIDCGAFGQVLIIRSAKDPSFKAALKIQCFTIRTLLEYLSREIIDGTKVKSQYLVRCLGFFPITSVKRIDKPFCMGLIQEECLYNLEQILPRLQDDNKLSPRGMAREVCDIMNQILKGARDLEQNDITHRDIKPKNICLGKDGYWKIIDFGLARALDENGDQTQGAGTAGYIPPDSSGPKHDVFSCAVVWYELMTGTLPWKKMGDADLVSPKKVAAAFLVDAIDEGKQMMDLLLKMIEFNETARLMAKEASPAMEAILKSLSE